MSTLKDVLCALAIVVAYGIAGRMDDDDAVVLNTTAPAPEMPAAEDCPTGDFPADAAQAEDPEPAGLGGRPTSTE